MPNQLFRILALSGVLIFAQSAFSQKIDLRSLSPEEIQAAMSASQDGKAQSLGGARENLKQPDTTPVQKVKNEPARGFGHSSKLRPFGEQFFANSQGFVVPTDMPVPADYVVGIGDIVELRLFGKENRLYQLPVERNGTITVPDIGSVTVAGMSVESLGVLLIERITKQKIGVDATVSMGPLRTIQFFLMGDVNRPGAYTANGLTTVVNAILVGGGIKPTGSMRKVEVRRNGRTISTIDLYGMMLKGGNKGELRLQSGDTIFIPSVGRRVGISGDVLRPAIYELLGERTAEDVIRLAGGLLPTAHQTSAKLDRIGQEGKRQILDIALTTAGQRRFELRDGDILDIPSVIVRWEKSVTLAGSVERPGNYEWKKGLHLGQLIPSYDALEFSAYRPLAIIERTDETTGARNFRTVNMLTVVRDQKIEPLYPEDRIFVLNQEEVNFLSSAKVQFVLSGKMPPATKKKAIVVGNESVVQDHNAEVGVVFDVSKKEKDKEGKEEDLGAVNECRGLIELSDVIQREGSARFRSALLTSAVNIENAAMVENQACPKLFDANPSLLPFLLENAITVRGEVKQPGVLPVAAGFPLESALNARGGLTREADLNGIEISRQSLNAQGRVFLKREIVTNKDRLSEITLQPGTLVLVRKRFSDQESGLIRLSGEFAHPGTYEFHRGEKLSDLIARAGGLTQQAYPLGTVFQRLRIKEEKKQYYLKAANEMQNSMLMAMTRVRTSGTSGVDASAAPVLASLIQQMRNIEPTGRVVVEADPVVLSVRPELDVVLEAGDEIHVPRRPSSILVMGEVLNPGAVQFVSGKKASDYINDVGGLTQMADESRIFAILPNGAAEPLKISSWNFSPRLLPPGSTIYVTREALPATSFDILTLSLQVAKDLALTAASLAVINK